MQHVRTDTVSVRRAPGGLQKAVTHSYARIMELLLTGIIGAEVLALSFHPGLGPVQRA
jgi:hypothetical protein